MARLEQKRKNRRKTNGWAKELLDTGIYLLVVLIMTYLVITYVGQRTQVEGSSMESTLSDGDNLIVDKLSYRFYDPERFDIIVFPYRFEPDTYYIKRIIGLPGETVRIDADGVIYINDEPLSEHYGKDVILDPGLAWQPIELGENDYFVLGDNRNNSTDSRMPDVGVLKRGELIGRAFVRIWPFSKFGLLHK
ncbi:MAG: signal peptidase I [Lachnospiraceae bacterium]|nr:signal peptidase I [Lachnospiraceae bacterium]